MRNFVMRKLCLGFCLLFITASVAIAAKPEIVSLKRIWDKAKYNSFTDLTRFKGKWYCTFRESDEHVGGIQGMIRVIVSTDGEKWESTGLFATGTIDMRDPKICVTNDNRLMLRIGAWIDVGGEIRVKNSQVSFSDDGISWTPLQVMQFNCPGTPVTLGHKLWRVIWHKGKAYGESTLNKGVGPARGSMLVSSTDGINWDQITRLDMPDASYGPVVPTETTIRILHDETMVALVRQAMIGTSKPPYKKWDWHETPLALDHPPSVPHVCTLGGPNFIELPDGSLWGSSRRYHRTDGFRKPTILFEMTYTNLERKLTLPSGSSPDYEDSSYAGMVWNPDDNLLWMTYYSSHECNKQSPGPKIYLVKIRVPLRPTKSK